MNSLAYLAAAVIFAAAVPKISAGEQVGVLVEYIKVDHRTGNKLIRKHATVADSTVFREEVGILIETGDAELIESTYITTRDGQRAKVESIEELLYPTEFEAGSFSLPNFADANAWKWHFEIPSAFDVRNVGITFEVDPLISEDGKQIQLSLAPEIVEYLGTIRVIPGEDAFRHNPGADQPLFATIRLSSAITVRDGGVCFAGQLTPTPKKSPGQRVLVFIHARILP